MTGGQQPFSSPKKPTAITDIVSPKHQLINKIHSQQLQNTLVNVPEGTAKRREQSITTRNRDPTLPKIIGAQKVLKMQQPRSKTSKKHLKPPSQLTLFDTMPIKPPSTIEVQEDVWGHFPEVIDSDLTLRLFFNNPNGLKLTSDPTSVQYSLSLIQAIGAGVISIAEANVNWSNLRVSNTFRNIIRKIWKHSTYVTSHHNGPTTGEIQPSGTLTLVNSNWTSRVIEKGSDPYGMGRWSYVLMRGKDGKRILIVTAYRVCVQTVSSSGPTTSTSQQHRYLSKEFREANSMDNPQPRKQFIVDLQAWLEHKNKAGCFIILALDANEGLGEDTGTYHPLEYTLEKPIATRGHDGTLQTLVRTCGLCDPLTTQHTEFPPPPTYRRGKERIDYIFVSFDLLPVVIRSGILNYDQHFIADHRPCYLDFDSKQLFGSDTPTIAPAQFRGLQLYDDAARHATKIVRSMLRLPLSTRSRDHI
jgi:hypothetical protein